MSGRVVSPTWREVKQALIGRRGWERVGVAAFRGPCPVANEPGPRTYRPCRLESDGTGQATVTCRACGRLNARQVRAHWAALLESG